MTELKPCPFCGGRWRWHYRHSVGSRMIEGRAECDGCGARMGDGLIALDDDDLRPRIAELVNARWERTCRMVVPEWAGKKSRTRVCSECGSQFATWQERFCPYCGAKVVAE